MLILATIRKERHIMKKRLSLITILDIIVYGIIVGFIAYAKIESQKGTEAFAQVIREDGWVEYLTTLFLVLGAILLGINAIKAAKNRDGKKIVFFTLSMLVFIFGAGEEILWGQRLLGIETNEYFLEKNYQGETNLHNLEIGGVDINKLIFSKLLFIGLIGYFILMPLLTYKIKAIRNLLIDFGVPMPRLHHITMLLVTNIGIITIINLKKESELHELALTGIFFLVFLNPARKIGTLKLKKE